MDLLIGKIVYPERSADVEFFDSWLYSGEKQNKLVFRLINRNAVALTAFHIDVYYIKDGEEKKVSIENRDYYLESGAVSEEFFVDLDSDVEEGCIVLPVALYDNLTKNAFISDLPFASFDVMAKVAANYLLGGVSPAPATRRAVQPPQRQAVPNPARTPVVQATKAPKAERADSEENLSADEIKKKKTKRILSIAFMCATLVFAIACIPWVNGLMEQYELIWGLIGKYAHNYSAGSFVFAMLVAITCAIISTLERKGFDKYRWVITTVNAFAGSLCFSTLVYSMAFYSSWQIVLLVFVYPVAPALITRAISKDAVPTVLLILAFGASWIMYMDIMAAWHFGPLLFSMIETTVLLVTGVLVKGKNKPRLKSSIVFSILTTVLFSISIVLFFMMGVF